LRERLEGSSDAGALLPLNLGDLATYREKLREWLNLRSLSFDCMALTLQASVLIIIFFIILNRPGITAFIAFKRMLVN